MVENSKDFILKGLRKMKEVYRKKDQLVGGNVNWMKKNVRLNLGFSIEFRFVKGNFLVGFYMYVFI